MYVRLDVRQAKERRTGAFEDVRNREAFTLVVFHGYKELRIIEGDSRD